MPKKVIFTINLIFLLINHFLMNLGDGKILKAKFGPLYDKLKQIVQNFLDKSSYNELDLNFLFKKFRPKISQK
jgi:hypothetical protein